MEDSTSNSTLSSSTLNTTNTTNGTPNLPTNTITTKDTTSSNVDMEMMNEITNEHGMIAKEIVYNSILSGDLTPKNFHTNSNINNNIVRSNSTKSLNNFKINSPIKFNTNPGLIKINSNNELFKTFTSNISNDLTHTNTNSSCGISSIGTNSIGISGISSISSIGPDTVTEDIEIANINLNNELYLNNEVYLNIYDLEKINYYVNSMANSMGIGAYHAGIEIYGTEYNYGYNPKGGTGITSTIPKFHPYHKYRKTINLGKTKFTPLQVQNIIQNMKSYWIAYDYNILHRNCLNFAKELSERLEVDEIPEWVMGLQNKINWTKKNINKGTNKLKVYNFFFSKSNFFPTNFYSKFFSFSSKFFTKFSNFI